VRILEGRKDLLGHDKDKKKFVAFRSANSGTYKSIVILF
jgi:hypothetical protein